MKETQILDGLSKWFTARCDGLWEHRQGVLIESTDNPGWWVKIDLRQTPFEGRPFPEVREGIGPDDHPQSDQWLHCAVKDGRFSGAGDPGRLGEILDIFLSWAKENAR